MSQGLFLSGNMWTSQQCIAKRTGQNSLMSVFQSYQTPILGPFMAVRPPAISITFQSPPILLIHPPKVIVNLILGTTTMLEASPLPKIYPFLSHHYVTFEHNIVFQIVLNFCFTNSFSLALMV